MGKVSTRQHIIERADQLFYERGFEATSFADIAQAVGISRGNFYHHFKKKDDLLDAVVERRMANTRMMLDQWASAFPEPKDRIRAFIQILIVNQAKIMAHGCPVGTLCAELAKLEHVAQNSARQIFGLFRDWLAEQFRSLGRTQGAEALALHLLGRSQGVTALAMAFRDPAFVETEVAALERWLDSIDQPALPQDQPS
ncbi:MAG: TetR/AcrR family transcriptional regulator [Neomegalonema sp.]|nr:TetR/AcrR family transcriptional regulator [Neomegalonema sp.]